MTKKILLLDGHSLAYRAFYGLPLYDQSGRPRFSTSKGELTNAIYGFATMLFKVWNDEKPDYIAAAFDKGRTFRCRHLEGAGNELGNLYRGPSLIGFDLSQHGNRTSHALGKFLTREPAFVALLLQPLSERAHYDPLA